MVPILVFDIETVPDATGLRRIFGHPPDWTDEQIVEQALAARRETAGHDFLQLPLHRIVSIACVLREGESLRAWSLGRPEDEEASLIARFFEGLARYTPQLVSWNGGGFDLPVLQYRAFLHGIEAAKYWETGDTDREFRYNNYLSRYHTRHIDLMDVLALYQARNYAPLDMIAKLVGLPGKIGMDGAQVWQAFRRGEIDAIRNYCEGDAFMTYLLFLRFERMRGVFGASRFDEEMERARAFAAARQGSPWEEIATALRGA